MHTPSVIITSRAVAELPRIERMVAAEHLTVGYAGYRDASALEWSGNDRFHVAPLLGSRHGVVLAPGDPTLPDRIPASLPRPARVVHVGPVTIAIWRHDIAENLSPSAIPVPGAGPAVLRQARRVDATGAPR